MNLIQSGLQKRNFTVFTVNVDDKVYSCPVSTEALHVLCRGQDASLNQVDAFLLLKVKVWLAVERLIEKGPHDMPGLLDPGHFLNIRIGVSTIKKLK